MSEPDGPLNINHWKDEADDVRLRRDKYWTILHSIRGSLPKGKILSEYLEETYGIKMMFDSYGNILASYEVIDEAKYLVFLLKYQ